MDIQGFNMTSSDTFDQFANTTGTVGEDTQTVAGYDLTAGFDVENGVLALIIGLIALGAVAGIQVVGSGLSDFSVSVIYKSIAFYAIWGLLSAFGLDALTAIPIFGWLLYFILTIVYSAGIIQQIGGVN